MSESPPRVVLASASPRREELLHALLDRFAIEPSDVPEELGRDAVEDAIRLARAKTAAVAARIDSNKIVLGADTIVFDEHGSYGKPTDAADAARVLRLLRGRTHSVVTAVALAFEGRLLDDHVVSRVTLTDLDDAAVDAYVASGRPLDKAGAYAIQDEDVPTVAKVVGCHCAVIGMALWRVHYLLELAGVHSRKPDATFARCISCPGRNAPPSGRPGDRHPRP